MQATIKLAMQAQSEARAESAARRDDATFRGGDECARPNRGKSDGVGSTGMGEGFVRKAANGVHRLETGVEWNRGAASRAAKTRVPNLAPVL
jgi:hypothetical protein